MNEAKCWTMKNCTSYFTRIYHFAFYNIVGAELCDNNIS